MKKIGVFLPVSKDQIKKISKYGDIRNDFNVDWIITNPNNLTFRFDESVLRGTPIKLINTVSTGTNHIDLDYCKENNIKVFSLKNDFGLLQNLPSTAELAMTLLLGVARHIPRYLISKEWNWKKNFIGREIKPMKVGVVGFGRLGKMFENMIRGFGCETLICESETIGGKFVNIDTIFRECDAISFHVHADGNNNLICADKINLSNKAPIIINTSRGAIANENDILKALKDGKIFGYGTDVLATEFSENPLDNILWKNRNKHNIMITPHIGGMTKEGYEKAFDFAIRKFGLDI